MPLSRLKEKTTKEILWVYILSLLEKRDMYAWEIKNELKGRFGFEPARVTSYVVLYRLEKGGYVEPRWEKNKKYYGITEKGRELLKEGKAYLKGLVEGLEG